MFYLISCLSALFFVPQIYCQSFIPVPWPNEAIWHPFSVQGIAIKDPAGNDPSNGGTTPQGYANISSGVPDQTLPSAFFAYSNSTFFMRLRLEGNPLAYTGGSIASTSDPFSSGQWTLIMDVNGDGWRDFAIHLDGSSGSPSQPTDLIRVLYSTLRTSQTLDPATPGVNTLASYYSAVPYTSGSYLGQLEQFDGSANVLTSNVWPGGRSTVVYDFGMTRLIDQSASGGQYLLDLQIPISSLDARPYGGPVLNPSSPVSMAFLTSNSLSDPFQKDFSYPSPYSSSVGVPMPGGDFIGIDGTSYQAPIISSISATTCPTVQLTTTVMDGMSVVSGITTTSSVASVKFYYWVDVNGNGIADEGSGSWILIGSGATTQLGSWTCPWITTGLAKGQYLVKSVATDNQNLTTDSYAESYPGYTKIYAIVNNSCGVSPPLLTKSVNKTSLYTSGTAADRTVTYTITVTNPLTSSVTIASIADQLPSTFSYLSVTGGSLVPTSIAQAAGIVTWSFSPQVSIPAGGTATLIFSALAPTMAGTYANSVNATGSTTFLSATNVSPIVITDVFASIQKTVSTMATLSMGSVLTYTMTYSNNGSTSLTNVQIKDTLAAGLMFGSASNGGTYNSSTREMTWSLGTVPSGQGGSVSVDVSVSNPFSGVNPVLNTARLYSSEITTGLSSNTVANTVASPTLIVQKSANLSNVVPGNYVTYTLTYGNIGGLQATNVVLTDTLPTNIQYVAGSSTPSFILLDTLTIAGRKRLRWSLGTVAAGSAGNVISFQVSIPNPYPSTVVNSPIVNSAYIGSDQTSAIPASNTIFFTALPSVTITKTSNKALYSTADSANFTIMLVNAGNTSASLSSITDSLPSGFSYVSTPGGTLTPTSSPTAGATGTITWSFIPNYSLSAGGMATLVFRAKVASTGGLYTNTAKASGILNTTASSTISTSYSFNVIAGGSTSIKKSVNKSIVYAGDTLTYTLVYTNYSGSNQPSLRLLDTIPPNTTYIPTYSASGTSLPTSFTNSPARVLLWNMANPYATNNNSTITFKVKVDSATAANTNVLNKGYTVVKSGSTDVPTASNLVSTTVLATPRISITKSANRTTAPSNSQITYTILYSNASGGGTATNVVISDTLPASLTYVAGSATGGGSFSATPSPKGRILWNIGSLPGGVLGSVSFIAKIDSATPNGTVVTNLARVTAAELINKSSSTTVTVQGVPSFAVTKAVDNTTAGPGDTLIYTVNYKNVGSGSASATTITDNVPANTSFISASSGGILSGNTVTWTIGAVNAGVSGSVNLKVKIIAPLATGSVSSITNSASITATGLSSLSSNFASTTISYPQLSLSKTVDSASISPGGLLTYTLRLSNSSTIPAVGVVLYDSIPANTTYEPNTTTLNGSPVPGDGSVSPLVNGIALGTISLDQTTTVCFRVRVRLPLANSTKLSNYGSVTSTTITNTCFSNSVITNVLAKPILTLAKSASVAGSAIPGAVITYTITYGNIGNTAADNFTIVDAIPANTTLVLGSISGTGGSYDPINNSVFVAPRSLPAGMTGQTLSFQVKVASLLPNGTTTISNTATASASNSPNVSAQTSTSIIASSTLNITKSAPINISLLGSPTPTANYTYTISYSVIGTATTDSVVITDVLASGLTYVSSTLNGVSGGSATGQTITFAIGSANPGSTGQATITVRTTTQGTYANSATIISRQNPTGTTSNTASTSVTQTHTGTLAQTSTIIPSNNIAITVTDADLIGQGAIFVTATNNHSNETEIVGLTETGFNSGIFSGMMYTAFGTTAGPLNDGEMNVQAGDSVRTNFYDAYTLSGAPATAIATTIVTGGITATITATPVFLAPANPITFTLTDADLNNNSSTAESYLLLSRNSTGETEQLTFIETGISTGIFTANITTRYGVTPGSNSDGIFTVQPGNSISVSYQDTLTTQGASVTIFASGLIGCPNFSTSQKQLTDINGGFAIPLDTILYQIIVRNSGNIGSNAVSVVDSLPQYISVVPGSITHGGAFAGRTIVFPAFDLAMNDSLKLSYRVTVDTTIPNQFVATNVALLAGNGITQTLYESFTAISQPLMVMTKSADKDSVSPGDTVTITISYSNIGTAPAAFVTVTDPTPDHSLYIPGSIIINTISMTDAVDADSGSVTNNQIMLNVGIVQPGQSGTIKFKVRIQ